MNRTARGIVAFTATSLLTLGLATPGTTAHADTVTADRTGDRTVARSVVPHLVENPAQRAFLGAVAPSECTADTPLNVYFADLAAGVTEEQRAFIIAHLDTLFLVPTYASLFLSTPEDPDYALDARRHELERTFRDLRRFWSDVRTDDIQVVGMHGDVLLDADRIAASLAVMVKLGAIAPMTASEMATEARTVADFMATQGDLYESPFWTFGAFAYTGELFTDPEMAARPDKIVIGDGTFVAYDALGLGDVGPRVVLAHEFAHHVQFELGTYGTGPADPAAATRRTELMADALATYYGVHKKGLALNRKRVTGALLTFYNVGDCGFDDPVHHGTPLQREHAAAWGADLADSLRPRAEVLPSATVADLFDAALPEITSGG